MTIREAVRADRAPRPAGAYSQGIVAGGFLFTAGVVPRDPDTSEVVGTTVEEQASQVMTNMLEILRARGLGFSHVVKTTVYLADVDRDFRAFNEVYQTFFDEPYPARTTIGSSLRNILVEIEAVAIAS